MPIFIDFEMSDVECAANRVKSDDATILEGVARRGWGAIDLILTVGDGYPVQLVRHVTD